MALISFDDDDPWVTTYDGCERLYRDIQSQLIAWEQEPRSTAQYGHLSSKIRSSLKQYRTCVTELTEQLKILRNNNLITLAENERRSHQIEILQSKCTQLQNQFNIGIQTSAQKVDRSNQDASRKQLFGGSSKGTKGYAPVKTVNWGTESDDEELIDNEYKPSIDELKQRQTQMIREQDDGLEALSTIISRQRNLAENLGNEVSLQNDIIDEIGEYVERTDGRVQQETQHVRTISIKDRTCGYWVVIILLLIAIIVVAVS